MLRRSLAMLTVISAASVASAGGLILDVRVGAGLSLASDDADDPFEKMVGVSGQVDVSVPISTRLSLGAHVGLEGPAMRTVYEPRSFLSWKWDVTYRPLVFGPLVGYMPDERVSLAAWVGLGKPWNSEVCLTEEDARDQPPSVSYSCGQRGDQFSSSLAPALGLSASYAFMDSNQHHLGVAVSLTHVRGEYYDFVDDGDFGHYTNVSLSLAYRYR